MVDTKQSWEKHGWKKEKKRKSADGGLLSIFKTNFN